MTSLQEEPSAQAPCTSTTLRAGTGPAGCAGACAEKRIAETMPRAITVNFRSVFISVSPKLMSRRRLWQQPTLQHETQGRERNQSHRYVGGDKGVRRDRSHRATGAALHHVKRYGGKRGGAERQGPIGRGKRLLPDPGQQTQQQKRLEHSVSQHGIGEQVGCTGGDAKIGDASDYRRRELDAEG